MFAIVLALPLGWAPPTRAGAATGPTLRIRGVAALRSGAPVPKARVTAVPTAADGAKLSAGRGFTATTDDSGHFALELALPDRAAIARRGYQLNVWVSARAMHFETLDGQSSLGLDLHLETLPDGAMRVVGAANDARLAALGARAVATGSRAELAAVLFTGVMGELTRDPGMPTRLEVARVAVSAPTTNAPAATNPVAPVAAASKPESSVIAPAAVKSPAPAPGSSSAKPPAAPAKSGAAATDKPEATLPRAIPAPAVAADPFRAGSSQEPVVAAPAPKGSGSPSSGGSSKRSRQTTTPAPITAAVVHVPAVPEPAPSAPDTTTCQCRISGTVEATAGDALHVPLRVAVWIEDSPAVSDTVTLDMGSPRPFELRGARCGDHRLAVRALSEHVRYEVRDPTHSLPVTCRRDRHSEARIELIAR